MLLKGLLEVHDATRPIQAAEMALIRLAYAADLPPTEKLVRDVLDNGAAPRPAGGASSATAASRPLPTSPARSEREPTMLATAPRLEANAGPILRSLADLAALAQERGAPMLKVNIEHHVHLVHLEPGKLEFRPSAQAPRTLSADLAQKLKEWTGVRWVVSVSREGGAPTIAETKRMATQAKLDSVAQEPLVRAVLDRFPGAEIVHVMERDAAPLAAEGEESE